MSDWFDTAAGRDETALMPSSSTLTGSTPSVTLHLAESRVQSESVWQCARQPVARTHTHTHATEHGDVKLKSAGKVNKLSTNTGGHHREAAWDKNRGLIIWLSGHQGPPPPSAPLPLSIIPALPAADEEEEAESLFFFPSLLSHLFQFVTLCPPPTTLVPPSPASPPPHLPPPPIPSHPPRV